MERRGRKWGNRKNDENCYKHGRAPYVVSFGVVAIDILCPDVLTSLPELTRSTDTPYEL